MAYDPDGVEAAPFQGSKQHRHIVAPVVKKAGNQLPKI
jgi:hypothetical protein